MNLTTRDIDTFKALNRYRYLRANFIHGLVGGSKQHVQRRLGDAIIKGKPYGLLAEGLVSRPEQQKQSWNARYSPRVYELTQKSKAVLAQQGTELVEWKGSRQFWHQLMVADIVSSFEMAAKRNGWRFRDHRQIIGDKPLSLPCYIEWGEQKVSKPIEPDALFALNDTYLILEADRNTENLETHNLQLNSYLRKLLCYRDVVFNKTTEKVWGIPTPFILTVTTSKPHLENIKALFLKIAAAKGVKDPKSYSLAYAAYPILGSFEEHPEPLLSLVDDQWDRIGKPPLVIRKEIEDGREARPHPRARVCTQISD
jgi:hypothetical protein